MPRRKKPVLQAEDEPFPDPEPEGGIHLRSGPTKPYARCLLMLNEDGSIAWDRMKDGVNTARVRAALRAEQKPGEGGDKPDLERKFSKEDVQVLYFVLGEMQVELAARLEHVERAEAGLFRYTDAEVASLDQPTRAILDKYAARLTRWADEIRLFGMLTWINGKKLLQFRFELERKRAEEQERKPKLGEAGRANGQAG
jgi:hypothetical protein